MNRLNSVIVDTSFFVALSNRRDRNHKHATQVAEECGNLTWLTTWPVIVEFCHLIPYPTQIQFFQEYLRGCFEILQLEDSDLENIINLYKKYADHPLDLADLSLIIVAEQLGHGKILTFDKRDFTFLRWGRNQPFINICDLVCS